jgi:hypothetical protein
VRTTYRTARAKVRLRACRRVFCAVGRLSRCVAQKMAHDPHAKEQTVIEHVAECTRRMLSTVLFDNHKETWGPKFRRDVVSQPPTLALVLQVEGPHSPDEARLREIHQLTETIGFCDRVLSTAQKIEAATLVVSPRSDVDLSLLNLNRDAYRSSEQHVLRHGERESSVWAGRIGARLHAHVLALMLRWLTLLDQELIRASGLVFEPWSDARHGAAEHARTQSLMRKLADVLARRATLTEMEPALGEQPALTPRYFEQMVYDNVSAEGVERYMLVLERDIDTVNALAKLILSKSEQDTLTVMEQHNGELRWLVHNVPYELYVRLKNRGILIGIKKLEAFYGCLHNANASATGESLIIAWARTEEAQATAEQCQYAAEEMSKQLGKARSCSDHTEFAQFIHVIADSRGESAALNTARPYVPHWLHCEVRNTQHFKLTCESYDLPVRERRPFTKFEERRVRIICALWKLLATPDVFPSGRVLAEDVLPTIMTSIAETGHVRAHYMRERDNRMFGCGWHIIKQTLVDPGSAFAGVLALASHEMRHVSSFEMQQLALCNPMNTRERAAALPFVRTFHSALSAKIIERHSVEYSWVPSLSESFSWIAMQTLGHALMCWRTRAFGSSGANGIVSSLKSALFLLPCVAGWDAQSGVCIELSPRELEALPPVAAACIREALNNRKAPLGRILRPSAPPSRQMIRLYPDQLASVLSPLC